MKRRAVPEGWAPAARRRDLIVKRLDGELLIYDVERHRAHSLGALLATLWQRCDGQTPPAALAEALAEAGHSAVREETVWLGLERLSASHLLREAPPATAAPPTRRQWLRQAAALGLAVVTVTVPTLAEAASTISNADCRRRSINNCGNTPCTGRPGTVCRLVARRFRRRCRCA